MTRAQSTSARLVLVIEADDALRRMLVLGLRQRGLRVLATSSLRMAWELLDEAPAIVVLDIGVGASSEWMWPRLLRRHRLLRLAPVVLLAWECPVAELAALAPSQQPTAPSRCLAKPFDARALFAAVDEVLAGSLTATEDGRTAGAPLALARDGAPDLTAGEAPAPPAAPSLTVVGSVVAPPAPGPLLSAEMAEPPVRDVPAPPAGGAGQVAPLGLAAVADDRAPETAASVWPLMAAGAATLAVAGFFIHPLYALLGLLLLLVVVLWWSTALVHTTPHA